MLILVLSPEHHKFHFSHLVHDRNDGEYCDFLHFIFSRKGMIFPSNIYPLGLIIKAQELKNIVVFIVEQIEVKLPIFINLFSAFICELE